MKFNKITPLILAPLAAAQYFNGSTTTLEPSNTENDQDISTYLTTVTKEIVNTVYWTLENNEVSTQLSTLTTSDISSVVTTLQPTITTEDEDDSTLTVRDESTSTTTITIYSTVSLDDSTTLDVVNAGIDQIYADDVTSTLTSVLLQTVTLSDSAGNPTATTVSSLEKQVLLGDFSCVPETVTVTQYEATKYITVDSSTPTQADTSSGSDYEAAAVTVSTQATSAIYSNTTSTDLL
ncbi:Svs1p [Kluyveromyces lactis]|uniref:KLLA0C10054p n=1 Tax=Kluyveromyces lactis (strain ATCC 8585 / CBS 2359 / DSM 70799 / NBRC 1267 / NRRL Y-1140 / WM37) TaxID=284590 RepID=Q6CTU2_KLULA|nr:uncharacterized protein KLLA0_C10054g [Kluyveromyces lactis]CAH01498.1 KLLA0C10054p [Kluyveromyces lactis]|eukprot:XP_452647.1 uncharacterized protein KLLA0_C10054g [Kluyveromyces lactis]